VPEVVFQHPLLDGHLRSGMQVLHLAAATGARVQAEVRAARPHPLRAFAPQGRHLPLLPVVLAPQDLDLHALGGQCTLNEDDLALAFTSRSVSHALRFEVQRLDFQPFLCGFHQPDYPGAASPIRMPRRAPRHGGPSAAGA
jgi:hypothetical protein